jgi:hypothetical protein
MEEQWDKKSMSFKEQRPNHIVKCQSEIYLMDSMSQDCFSKK